jgi:enoyl-[acyl-carrier protein] reductase I
MTSTLLVGKRGLVFGASSRYSLGLTIAQAWTLAGASQVTVACETLELRDKVYAVAKKEGWWDADRCRAVVCNVNVDEEIAKVTADKVDMILHSVAFAPTSALRAGSLLQYTRSDFSKTMETSAYSLLAIASRAKFSQETGGSIISLTFDASRRVVNGYGPMAPAKAALETLSRYLAYELGKKKIRVNCISAGPINTPAARGIPNFQAMLDSSAKRSALGRPVMPQEVAATACFLASNLSSGITGQIIHVDCGENFTTS